MNGMEWNGDNDSGFDGSSVINIDGVVSLWDVSA